MSDVKVYYMNTQDTYNATNSGEDGLVLKSDYDKLEAKLKIARDAISNYGEHQALCALKGGYGYCSCGLELTLKQLEET